MQRSTDGTDRRTTYRHIEALVYHASSVNNVAVKLATERVYSLSVFFLSSVFLVTSLQCFDAVGWAAGRASGL